MFKELSLALSTWAKAKFGHDSVMYKMFGTVNISSQVDHGHSLSVEKHNKQVDKNRHILKQVIKAIIFCGVHELALRGHDEKVTSTNLGVFLDLLAEKAESDKILEEHLNSFSVAKNTSKTIQNELLDCMLKVYQDQIKNEVSKARYVSVQADETTDISCKSQFVVILRYIKDSKPVERFTSFIEVTNRTAAGLFNILHEHLQLYNVDKKLIAQAYDGAANMSGAKGRVQTLIKEIYPSALYVHCYAHQLNLIFKKACSSVKRVRIFFASLTTFKTFFSHSAKRNDILREVCGKTIPTFCETRWNFHSRIVSVVNENKNKLLETFDAIMNAENMDDTSICEAKGLWNWLNDSDFLYLLAFFDDVLRHADILFNIVQSRKSSGITVMDAVSKFKLAILDIQENLHVYISENEEEIQPLKRRATTSAEDLEDDVNAVCSIILNQIETRFENSHVISTFSLVDPSKFLSYKLDFPSEELNLLTSNCSFISNENLKKELKVLYTNETFRPLQTPLQLLECFNNNKLFDLFPETSKLLEIVLVTPVTSAESERCFSTLKRIKNFLRNSMGQERLDALAMLSIHKELILNDMDNFISEVLNYFAKQKNRRAEYLYQQ